MIETRLEVVYNYNRGNRYNGIHWKFYCVMSCGNEDMSCGGSNKSFEAAEVAALENYWYRIKMTDDLPDPKRATIIIKRH